MAKFEILSGEKYLVEAATEDEAMAKFEAGEGELLEADTWVDKYPE